MHKGTTWSLQDSSTLTLFAWVQEHLTIMIPTSRHSVIAAAAPISVHSTVLLNNVEEEVVPLVGSSQPCSLATLSTTSPTINDTTGKVPTHQVVERSPSMHPRRQKHSHKTFTPSVSTYLVWWMYWIVRVSQTIHLVQRRIYILKHSECGVIMLLTRSINCTES